MNDGPSSPSRSSLPSPDRPASPSDADEHLIEATAAHSGSPAGQMSPEGAGGLDTQADQWLVGKASSGDPQALEVLIRRHRDRIYRIALRMLGSREDAEDVTQEVVIQVWTAIAGFSGVSAFTTWLYRIVVNRCISHQRRQRPTRPLSEGDDPSTPGPENAVLARRRVEATADALARLPGPLRSSLVLHEMEGLSYQEVASILRLSEATVRGRIYRARRQLVEDLQDWS